MERIGSSIKGIYRDILLETGDRVIHDSGWVANTILDGCRILLAGFIRDDSSSNGIQYMAVGQGLEAWDANGAPAPDPVTTVDLENRYDPPIPALDLEMVYLDENDAVVINPTSRLQIKATLPPGYPVPEPPLTTYPLREFGLFGQFDSTPYMINVIRHPVIHKDESATLIRMVRLYF
jgi:hypothetical protein